MHLSTRTQLCSYVMKEKNRVNFWIQLNWNILEQGKKQYKVLFQQKFWMKFCIIVYNRLFTHTKKNKNFKSLREKKRRWKRHLSSTATD